MDHEGGVRADPGALRGLVERDRKLLALLSQTFYVSILKAFRALLDRPEVRPGCVISLRTFGAYGANFNPDAQALVTDGVFSDQGESLPLPSLDTAAVMQVFRRLLLGRLHRAGRLSEDFMHKLLSWVHPGFSVSAGPPVDGAAATSLESQARYITRPSPAMDALEKLENDSPDTSGPPHRCALAHPGCARVDPHRITAHILDPGRHCQRFYGAYSNRRRVVTARPEEESIDDDAGSAADRDHAESSRESRSTWARLVRRIFETGALLCSCGARMRIVSFITDPHVVDRILRHRESERCKVQDPFEPRAPPTAPPGTPS